MDRVWSVLFNLMLIGSSTYGLTSKSLRGERLALLGFALYCATGWLGLACQITSNDRIADAEFLAYGITAIAGIDLLATEVCIVSGVQPRVAYLLLIPSALDLFMRYVVDTYWNPNTQFTHLFSLALFFNFAIRDSRQILFVSGLAFLFALFTESHYHDDDVIGFQAIAVFATAWFLEGKDFRDFGF